jgi:hypothetical protein
MFGNDPRVRTENVAGLEKYFRQRLICQRFTAVAVAKKQRPSTLLIVSLHFKRPAESNWACDQNWKSHTQGGKFVIGATTQ